MKLSDLKAMEAKASEGEWLDLYPGVQVKIVPPGTKEFDEYLQKLLRPEKLARRGKIKIKRSLMLKATQLATAKYVLVDWKGFTEEEDDQVVVPYSPERAMEYFETSYQFYRDVQELAGVQVEIEEEEDEDAVEN